MPLAVSRLLILIPAKPALPRLLLPAPMVPSLSMLPAAGLMKQTTAKAIQSLGSGDTLTETLSIQSVDGTTQNIVITINGTNDAAVISGTSTGAVTEEGASTLNATGSLTVTDTDAPAKPALPLLLSQVLMVPSPSIPPAAGLMRRTTVKARFSPWAPVIP